MAELVKRSKNMSYWLRHKPQAGGIILDDQGWTDVSSLLDALNKKGTPTDFDLLERVVSQSGKNRFELSQNKEKIRARQGHSVQVDLGWEVTPPPQVLYHGTVERFLDSIMDKGLVRGKRHHVHLSPDIETATAVGSRRGEAIILEVAAQDMTANGAEFYLSSNGVWLADHIPPEYLKLLAE